MAQPNYWVSYSENGTDYSGPICAKSRELAQELIQNGHPNATNVYARAIEPVIAERIRENIQKVKLSPNCHSQDAVKERLRCCVDVAYLLGYDSLISLDRTLSRMVAADDELTGLDSCMFSFGFRASAGYYGGIIFHTSSKTWSAHT